MNRDFAEILRELSAVGADFLIVGAHALAAHGHVRATKDLDLFIRPSPENAERVWRALAAFGAPLDALTPEDLTSTGTVFQIGVDPVRIDVLTSIDGLGFEEAWQNRIVLEVGGSPLPFLSREDLITNKRAAGRPQDLVDADTLEKLP
ncbi:MAG: nucleotidyltransferase [Acidobacteria bacterium]|nr:nucleotidyltransferase [Acidobacteriota bacterium]